MKHDSSIINDKGKRLEGFALFWQKQPWSYDKISYNVFAAIHMILWCCVTLIYDNVT